MEASRDRRRDEARGLLRDEMREAVGKQATDIAERQGALDEAIDADRPKTVLGALGESRALIAITFAVALIVGAVIALITGAWWFLLVALVLHGTGTVVVVATTLSLASQTEHADPRTVAALEERGVANPDAALNQAIGTAAEAGDPDAQAVRDQQTAVTPQSDAPDSATGRRRSVTGARDDAREGEGEDEERR